MNMAANIEEHTEILSRITTRMQAVAPAGWNRIDIVYGAIGDNDFGGCSALVFNSRGGVIFLGWLPPEDVTADFAALRAAMAAPVRGAWLQAKYFLKYPDSYSIEYFRNPRAPKRLPSALDCVRELELFPRSADNVPDWMQQIIDS
ncbi:hypothetical protein ACFVAV_04515 [Nocardia sp. NPDC057663]|uniref:hypothetical protein n=1 Tax=Nocardia sp. NPDC057663 TaxID=3346201 RepID=UPI00366B01B3